MAFRNPGWSTEAMEVGLGEDELERIERKLWGGGQRLAQKYMTAEEIQAKLNFVLLDYFFSCQYKSTTASWGKTSAIPKHLYCSTYLHRISLTEVSKPHDSMQRTGFYWQISTSPSRVEKWHLDYLNPV